MRTVHDLKQGSNAWNAHRARTFNASEAAAVMGASKFTTRAELLRQKATGLQPEVSAARQALFDRGHAVEAPTIAMIEDEIADSLAPVVATFELDGLTLGASYDGLTLFEDTAAEVKLWNEDLAAQIRKREIEPHYYWQLEHQFIVTPTLERILFATSDGTPERMECMEYRPVPGRREALLAGWKQFAADLAAYVPNEIVERPAAEVTLALPALVIHAKGEITTSNMKEYGEALAKRLAEVRAIQLVTDQDFSNAKESAKLLRENIQQAKHAKEAMLAQTVTVGEAARMIDVWCEDMRLTALKLEQDVEREDKAKKAAMIGKARTAYEQHIEALKAETGGPWIVLPAPNFPDAIKGKRNFSSMQDALDTMLASGKIAADESARKIRAALACMAEEGKGYEFLLADRLAHIGKPVEDVRTLVRARITEHKAEEQRRAEAAAERERERIRAEEQAKAREAAAAEARQRLEAEALERRQREETAARERREREAAEALARQAAQPPTPAQPPAAAPIAPLALSSQAAAPSPTVVPIRPAAPAAPATLKLGALCDRFGPGWTMTADFLARLGIQPAAVDKAAKLYTEPQFDQLCEALVAHVRTVQAQQRQAA